VSTHGGQGARSRTRVWIDIENPPQVQYLVPLVHAFHERGCDVDVTARDYGITLDLLRERGVDFVTLGTHYGASKRAKVAGTARRIRDLRLLFPRGRRPRFVVSASRSASLAARSLGIASFALCDYEFVNLFAFRLAGSYVVHPDVIPVAAFCARGVAPARLVPYRGIKEDITFARVDVAAAPEQPIPELEGATRPRVLFRPPAEESHYHRAESSALGRLALESFASDARVTVVFSPRYPWQVDVVDGLEWRNTPVVLRDAIPFLQLLRGVDVVVSGGGTMTREAAYLGIPAVSLFQGHAGGVDQFLQRAGRLTMISSAEDLERLDLAALRRFEPLRENPNAASDVVDAVLARTP
jgi:uncharacterized protein